MRIRTIKPSFWTDIKMSQLSEAARLTYIGLWCYADDDGVFAADPRLVKAALYPLDDNFTVLRVNDILSECSLRAHCILYEVAGEMYGYIPNFKKHQKINRKSLCILPKLSEGSVRAHGVLSEHSNLFEQKKTMQIALQTGSVRAHADFIQDRDRDRDREVLSEKPPKTAVFRSDSTATDPKPKSDAQKNTICAIWMSEYKRRHHVDYMLTGPDKGALKELEQLFPPTGDRKKFKAVAKAYLDDTEPFVSGQHWPLKLLPQRINKYLKNVVFSAAKAAETKIVENHSEAADKILFNGVSSASREVGTQKAMSIPEK